MKTIVIIGAIAIAGLTILFFTLSPKETAVAPEATPNTDTSSETVPTAPATSEAAVIDIETSPTGRLAAPTGDKGGEEITATPTGKLKAEVFSGKLEVVNTGCFADGECFVEVDGKHITTLMGWSRDTVGQTLGVEGFGDLESHIGETVEVYAQVNPDGTYTLYGNEGFYVKLK